MARTKNATTVVASAEVPAAQAPESAKARGRKRKADAVAEVPAAQAVVAEAPAAQATSASNEVSAPAKKRARKSKAAAGSVVQPAADVVMADAAEASSSASGSQATVKDVKVKPAKAKREFIFMEEKDGTWQRTKFKYTQKRPGEAEQAGCKALTRHLKKAGQSKTSAPIALWEKDTENVYFYNGEVVPLETPKIIEREGAKPYEVTHKTTCHVPEGSKNPRRFNSLGRGKGFKLVEAQ